MELSLVVPKLFNSGLTRELFQNKAVANELGDMSAFTYLFSIASEENNHFTSNSLNNYFFKNNDYPYLSNLFCNEFCKGISEENGNFPLAVFTNQSEDNSWTWVYHVNPIFLHADLNQVVLSHDLLDSFTPNQSKSLCSLINDYFNQSNEDNSWSLSYQESTHEFYLLSHKKINWNTQPITNMVGKVVNESTVNQINAYWKQTLTEIQMLLFTSDLNRERKEKSLVEVNSLWCWGGGKRSLAQSVFSDHLINEKLLNQAYQIITNDSNLARLSTSMNLSIKRVDLQEFVLNSSLYSIVYFNNLESALKEGDLFRIIEVLNKFEKKLFKPLLYLINSGQLKQLSVYSDGQVFSISKPQYWSHIKTKIRLNSLTKSRSKMVDLLTTNVVR